MNTTYAARLIKDLAITFNYAALTPQEIASYWKRSRAAIEETAQKLAKKDVVRFNTKGEIELTPNYKKFFRKNPDTALSLVRQGL